MKHNCPVCLEAKTSVLRTLAGGVLRMMCLGCGHEWYYQDAVKIKIS